jgi:hypothetical protein
MYQNKQATLVWTLREEFRTFLTPNHMDQEKLEDLNLDGKTEFSKISGLWTSGTGGIWL